MSQHDYEPYYGLGVNHYTEQPKEAMSAYTYATASTSAVTASGQSRIEAAILRSSAPIDIGSESEEISVNGERGLWANKAEVAEWRGPLPIGQYAINDDPDPEIVTKRSDQQIVYRQEIAIR